MGVRQLVVRKNTLGENIFDIANITVLTILCALCIYPFLYIFNLSISEGLSGSQYGLNLLPKGITFKYYAKTMGSPAVYWGFFNSVFRTVAGTLLSTVATVMPAYAISKKCFPNRNFWTTFILIPMFFGGGLIPTYFLIKSLGLIDNRLVLILPGLISTYNIILIRTFIQTIPDSLEESAKIDGANEVRILFKIILPICKPILATIALWTAVGHWNAWFDSLLYITSERKVVLQVVLQQIVTMGTVKLATNTMSTNDMPPPFTIISCTIMITTLPIIFVYPFLQKYFIQGIMIGSLKG